MRKGCAAATALRGMTKAVLSQALLVPQPKATLGMTWFGEEGRGRKAGCYARICSGAGSAKCQGMERNFPWQVVLLSVSLARRRLAAPGNPSSHSSDITNVQPDFVFCMVTVAGRV